MYFNHLRTITQYTAIASASQNLLKLVQKYGDSNIKDVHNVKDDLTLSLKDRGVGIFCSPLRSEVMTLSFKFVIYY